MTATSIVNTANPTTIPEYLIRERMEGKPFYFWGYKDVLNKQKKLEDIMGCSSLQSYILEYLRMLFYTKTDIRKYILMGNEIGYHIDHNENLSRDMAIYEKSPDLIAKINKKYIDIAPLIAIEVDINSENDEIPAQAYQHLKIQRLLDWGTEKVIWINTDSRKVTVATMNAPWQIHNWRQDIDLVGDITFNIGAYLQDEGVRF